MKAAVLLVLYSAGILVVHAVLTWWMADANVAAVLLSAGGTDPLLLVGALLFVTVRLAALLGVPALVGYAAGLVLADRVEARKAQG